MAFHVFVFLLVFFLILSLALLWRLCWFHLRPSSSRGGAKRSRLQRLRHRPAQTIVPPVVSPPHPRRLEGQRLRMSRPWREVKSRRGAPKRVNTEGFACPNPQCPSFGISDAHVHALVGDGKHGLLERIQTFGCQACRTTFTARRPTPLSRLKPPSRAGSQWCSQRWRKGWILRLQSVCSAFDKPPSPAFLTRAGLHAQTLHERFFCHLQLPHLQLDELRTRLRCARQVLWLWLAIDPCTKLLPVLHLGPRTQHMAHRVIHSLRQLLAAFLPLALYE
jgi:transposase-like protein